MSEAHRKCPVCDVNMRIIIEESQEIDLCQICGGTYYDANELPALIELIGVLESVHLKEDEVHYLPESEINRHLQCPHDGVLMQKMQHGQTTIDVCPDCKGVWLDEGELNELRDLEHHIKEHIELYRRLGE